jgi:benzoyl-CoA reductase/2-hydroxyglutaryl-CoA dehydratase subunit BcrC/BadD/HgdB
VEAGLFFGQQPVKQSARIGITATLPVEVILAAGLAPVDLNNLFIGNPDPAATVEKAERAGLPQNTCAWIKGIYFAAHEHGIERVVGVTGGDCTNTRALLEIWQSEGIETMEFSYPYPADQAAMQREIERLCRLLGTSVEAAEQVREELQSVRALAAELDRLTWKEARVTGEENHRFLVGMSDFEGDYRRYEKKLRDLLNAARSRPSRKGPRIGMLGVPPIVSDLHAFVEARGPIIVFNEFQRQFAMPFQANSLAQQYSLYTYPYDTAQRMADVRKEIRRRSIDGVINYVQNFCWRALTDRLVRKALDVPVLSLQADKPGPVGGPIATRLEAFVEMLQG